MVPKGFVRQDYHVLKERDGVKTQIVPVSDFPRFSMTTDEPAISLLGSICKNPIAFQKQWDFLLLPIGLPPQVVAGVGKKDLANKTSVLQSRWFGSRITKEQGGFTRMKNEVKHTAHSSYRCECHVVFASITGEK